VSKANGALVRLGLESQEHRKPEFLQELKENLANHDPRQQDRRVGEFGNGPICVIASTGLPAAPKPAPGARGTLPSPNEINKVQIQNRPALSKSLWYNVLSQFRR